MRVARVRAAGAWLAAVAPAVAWPAAVSAQAVDVETAGLRSGIPVPAAFYRELAADPTAYTLPHGLFRIDADGQPAVQQVDGVRRIAVIPALFADSPEPHIAAETIQQRLFDGPSPRGTLTEAYREMSMGSLTVTGEVAPWVRSSVTREEAVGESNGLGRENALGAFLIDALGKVDPDYDFGLYDNDGPDGIPNSWDDDGWVDALAFEFIEVAASCGGPGVWPHLWGIRPRNDGEPYVTDDLRPDGTFVKVDAYIIQSAVECSGQEPQSAEVIAHEFGHVLGLPDFYHPTVPEAGAFGRRWVLGCWELMAAGAWGCGEHGSTRGPFGPTHISAWSKGRLGWLFYQTIGEVWDEELELKPVQEAALALRIPLDDENREYLLMEYRTQEGFDADLPASGVLIYHLDGQGQFRPPPDSEVPYFLALLERDDNNGLIRNTLEGGNRGEASDAWGVDGDDRKLNAETAPNSRLNDGSVTSVAVHSLRIEDGVARIRLSTGRTPRIVPDTDPVEVEQVVLFEHRLRIAGGYMPYEVEGEVPEGLILSAQGDELVVAGSLVDPGPHGLELSVVDARGNRSAATPLAITAGEWEVTDAELVASFLGSGAAGLTRAELIYLDAVGNDNGQYDVGDLRAFLRRNR